MPRFVILLHEMPKGSVRKTHWDLMLEHDNVLRTWALAEMPGEGETVAAEQLADHRLAYLQYEGPVSSDRGSVRRIDEGRYETAQETPTVIVVRLHGQKLSGVLTLRRDDSAAHRWRVVFSPG